ncbi:hypothetical protein BANRA_03080 [Escherichia coli]|nr:hypothetical protein BANRA_03080 [Escherichia coli]
MLSWRGCLKFYASRYVDDIIVFHSIKYQIIKLFFKDFTKWITFK